MHPLVEAQPLGPEAAGLPVAVATALTGAASFDTQAAAAREIQTHTCVKVRPALTDAGARGASRWQPCIWTRISRTLASTRHMAMEPLRQGQFRAPPPSQQRIQRPLSQRPGPRSLTTRTPTQRSSQVAMVQGQLVQAQAGTVVDSQVVPPIQQGQATPACSSRSSRTTPCSTAGMLSCKARRSNRCARALTRRQVPDLLHGC